MKESDPNAMRHGASDPVGGAGAATAAAAKPKRARPKRTTATPPKTPEVESAAPSPRIAELARDHSQTALAALVEIATDREVTASTRVAAAAAILDRAYGKPAQAQEVIDEAARESFRMVERRIVHPED